MKKRRIIFFHFSWVKPSIMWVLNHALTTHVISILRLRVWNLAWELLIHDFYSSFFFFFFSSRSLWCTEQTWLLEFLHHILHIHLLLISSPFLFLFFLSFFLLWPLMVLKQEFLVCFRLFIQSIQNMSPTALCCSGSSVHPSGHQGQGTTWTVCLHHMAK